MSGQPQRLTLVQQNDTHAHIEPHWEHYWHGGSAQYRRTGGLARAASIVRTIREETGNACLFLDCGDTIHGTGPAQWTQGAAIVPVLNVMGIDAMTPGNWEYGFGPEILSRRSRELQFPLLAANVERAGSGGLLFPATLLREVGGLPVGLVGLTSPIVGQMPRPFGAGLRFSDGHAELRESIRGLRREGAELIVALSHLGLPHEVQLLREVDDVDVLLSAHTHDRLHSPLAVGRTLLIQSGCHGSFLGRLDLEIRNGRICGWSHRLIEVDAEGPRDAETERQVDEQLAPFRTKLDEVVGETAAPLHRMSVLEAPMDLLITEAYREATGAEVAFSHGWRYGVPIPAGPITLGDLWQMIPTDPPVFTVDLTGQQIREKLEGSLHAVFAGDPLQQRGGYVIRTSGLSAVVRLNNPLGARVLELEVAGVPVDARRHYRVAAAGEQDVSDGVRREELGKRAVEVVRDYLARHSPFLRVTAPAFIAM